MGTMKRTPALVVVLAAAAWVGQAGAARLDHRVWWLGASLSGEDVSELRRVGIDGVVVPVGSVEVVQGGARLTLGKVPELQGADGWHVVPLVWVRGRGDAAGDAEAFLNQFSVVGRNVGARGVVLAAREYWPGLPRFAAAVAKRSGAPVEVAMAATAIASAGPSARWRGVTLVAVAFGNPLALGFAPSTLHDDLQALEAVDELDIPFRVAVIVEPTVQPAMAAAGDSLVELAKGSVAEYRPSQRGDAFVLRSPLAWGGTLLPRGATIEVEAVDTARYHRDLGLLLRPVRQRLLGWDTVGMLRRAPTVGMSWEAFLDYLLGRAPRPAPEIVVEWPAATRLRVAVANGSPHASAAASGGNWVELVFPGGVVGEVELGEFRGLEYGQVVGGRFRRAPSGEASAIRLFVTLFAPMGQVGAAEVRFVQRPRELLGRWGARLADGTDISEPARPLPLPGPKP